jgi:superfamily I DNA and/or RNA helicase
VVRKKIAAKAHKLFDYLEDVVKLGYKVVYDLKKHNDFLLTTADIKEIEKVNIKEDFYYPPGKLLTIQRLNEAQASKDNNKLFDKLFNLKKRLQYEEKTELVLGYGILLWEQNGEEIRYPLLTRNVVIKHAPKENVIEVLAPDDAGWKLELDALIDLGVTQLGSIRTKFNQLDIATKNNDNIYLDLLYEATGITVDGIVVDSDSPLDLARDEQLKIVDNWVLFMRKRKQNQVLQDIEEFRSQLKDDSVQLPDSINKILSDPQQNNFEWDRTNFHDEWSSYLDKAILFPKRANDEQVKILDCLQQSDGVVVQGPPGTGKSHTIANLISHFMAQGQKVLVTSQKDQALKVLTEMIPPQLKSLAMALFQNDANRKQKLEQAVTDISDIVSNQSYAQLKSELERLEEQFATIKERLEIVVSDLQELAESELEVKTSSMKYSLTPAKLAKKVKATADKYSWFEDSPDYQLHREEEYIYLEESFPITEDELATLKQLRFRLKPNLDNLVDYDPPPVEGLVDLQKYRIMSHELKRAKELKNKLESDYPDLIFKVDPVGVSDLLNLIKETLNIYNEVNYSKSLRFVKENHDLKSELEAGIDKLGDLVEEINDLQQQVGTTTKVDLDSRVKLSDYLEYVKEAISRVEQSKAAVSWFDIFSSTKKQALENILVNQQPVSNLADWVTVKNYIELQLKTKEFIAHWSGLENNFVGQLPELSRVITAKIKHNYKQLKQAFRYKYHLLPKLKTRLEQVIIGDTDISEGDFADQLKNLYYVFKLKEEESDLNQAQKLFDSMKEKLRIYREENNHPAVDKLLDCLNITEVEQLEDKIAQWSIYYKQLKQLNHLLPAYKKYKKLVDKLATQAPNWAEKWLDSDYDQSDLHLDTWQEAWEHASLKSYLESIAQREEQVAELETQQEQFKEQLLNLKQKLVMVQVKLKLKENTSQADINALKKWKHAVNRLGKGTGKNAAKWRKEAHKYMKKAKNAVPTWIMPLYRVSETIDREFGSFDVVIIDEASQSNITALLAVARAKKVIVVGDEKQISPSLVGISRDKIEVFIEQHLAGLANKNMMDLKTSFYDIAKATFDGRYNLMLKEHFRSLAEIIEFSNHNFYEGEILPLRNIRDANKLKPTLENVYLEEGRVDNKGQVNREEARAICAKVEELIQDPLYQDKTFGVISLKGKQQAEYISKQIDQYLTPRQQEKHKFLAGDPYTFQGDERDVILLSMVVATNRRFRALTRTSAKQRFNVAVSRARDQIILVHSVKLDEDLDNQDDMRYKLLDYIKNQPVSLARDSKPEPQTELEEDLFNWLREEGYEVSIQEQVGNYVIDLVVEGTENRLGIECDGDQLHSPGQWWADRRKLRQLERVGWDIYSLRGTNFYLNPEQSKARLKQKLNDSL